MKTEQVLKLARKFVSNNPSHAQSIGMIQQKDNFICATDGFRLAKIAYQSGGIECYFDQNSGVLRQANYPNVERVIPKQIEQSGFNRKDLLWLLKICSQWQTQANAEYKRQLKDQHQNCEIKNVLIGFEFERITCTVIAETWETVPVIGERGKPLKNKTKRDRVESRCNQLGSISVGEHHWTYALRGKHLSLQYLTDILQGLKLCNDRFYGDSEFLAGTPNINSQTQPVVFQSPSMFFMLMPIKP